MQRKRIMLATYVDLDPIPGTFHTADSARNCVAGILKQSIPHYTPVVSIVSYAGERHEVVFDDHNKNWCGPNPELNHLFLKSTMNYCSELLAARGYLFLNEVYANLGVPQTREGQIVGWTEGPFSYDIQYDASPISVAFWTEGSIIDKAFKDDQ